IIDGHTDSPDSAVVASVLLIVQPSHAGTPGQLITTAAITQHLQRHDDPSQRKQYLDTLGGLWAQGQLADKVYSGFTATATKHGGQESTLLALYNSIYHFGGIVVAPGYTDASKFADGNPYGTSHVDGQGTIPVDDIAINAARFQGRRVATIT